MSLAVPVEFPNSDTFDAWVHDPNGENPRVDHGDHHGPAAQPDPGPGTTGQQHHLVQGHHTRAVQRAVLRRRAQGRRDRPAPQPRHRGPARQHHGELLPGAVRGQVRAQGRGVSQVAAGRPLRRLVRRRQRVEAATQRACRGPRARRPSTPSTPTTRASPGRSTTATATASWTTSPSSTPAWARRRAAASRASSPSGRTLPRIDLPGGLPGLRQGLAPGSPDRDIYVREYSMDPENLDVGVIAEEYGHAAFGLPDIYTTDAQASPSNWAIMEAGSWNGIAGRHAAGAVPAVLPLHGRLGQAGRARLHHRPDHRQGRPALAAPEGHPAGRSRSTCPTRSSTRPTRWAPARPGGPTGPTSPTSTWPTTST